MYNANQNFLQKKEEYMQEVSMQNVFEISVNLIDGSTTMKENFMD